MKWEIQTMVVLKIIRKIPGITTKSEFFSLLLQSVYERNALKLGNKLHKTLSHVMNFTWIKYVLSAWKALQSSVLRLEDLLFLYQEEINVQEDTKFNGKMWVLLCSVVHLYINYSTLHNQFYKLWAILAKIRITGTVQIQKARSLETYPYLHLLINFTEVFHIPERFWGGGGAAKSDFQVSLHLKLELNCTKIITIIIIIDCSEIVLNWSLR